MANIEKLSEAALDLIIDFEVGGGRSYYDRYLKRPTWPGGASGVTIGVGYDLGYDKHFESDFKDLISDSDMRRLARTKGLTGSRAKQAISGVRDIIIPWEAAMAVFEHSTLPEYIRQTVEAFPKSVFLPDDAFGALVSIVFNRGPLIDNSPRRKEMKAIHRILELGGDDVVDNDDIKEIARQVRSMARLWPDTSSDGDLHDRRLAEAKLIENSIS